VSSLEKVIITTGECLSNWETSFTDKLRLSTRIVQRLLYSQGKSKRPAVDGEVEKVLVQDGTYLGDEREGTGRQLGSSRRAF